MGAGMHRLLSAAAVTTTLCVTGCGGSARRPGPSARPDAAAAAETTPDLASCVSDWNTDSTAGLRSAIGLIVAAQRSRALTVAAYAGPTQNVQRSRSAVASAPASFPAGNGACLVIAGDQVDVQQADNSWLPSEAVVAKDFDTIAADRRWSRTHANAAAQPQGTIRARSGATLVTLTARDVNGGSTSLPATGVTGATGNSGTGSATVGTSTAPIP